MSKVTNYLASMEADVTDQANRWTREESQEWAGHHWKIRWSQHLTSEEEEALRRHWECARGVQNVDTNSRGNTVVRANRQNCERYWFDFDDDFRAAGWLQFDTNQDAWYYGVWVNPQTLRTLTYAEGDVYLAICPDAEHYNAEIKRMCEFHGEGFEFIACDGDAATSLLLGGDAKGEATVCRQDRSMFFVKV